MGDSEGSKMGNGLAARDDSKTFPASARSELGPLDGHVDNGDRVDAELDIVSLVQQHHQAVYRYAYRLTQSAVDAEDLTQQTFLVAQEKLSQIRQPDKVDRWLLAVLRSRFLKEYRKRIPAPMSSLEMEAEDLPQDGPVGQETVDREALDRALGELPDSHRLVLVMHYFEDCSYKEIARQLQIPIGTVMSRLARAKTNLRQQMVRHRNSLS